MLCCEELLYEWEDFVTDIEKRESDKKQRRSSSKRTKKVPKNFSFVSRRKRFLPKPKKNQTTRCRYKTYRNRPQLMPGKTNKPRRHITKAEQKDQKKSLVNRVKTKIGNARWWILSHLCLLMKKEMSRAFRFGCSNYKFGSAVKQSLSSVQSSSSSSQSNKQQLIKDKSGQEITTTTMNLDKKIKFERGSSASSYLSLFWRNLKFLINMKMTDKITDRCIHKTKCTLFKYHLRISKFAVRKRYEMFYQKYLEPKTEKKQLDDGSVKYIRVSTIFIY